MKTRMKTKMKPTDQDEANTDAQLVNIRSPRRDDLQAYQDMGNACFHSVYYLKKILNADMRGRRDWVVRIREAMRSSLVEHQLARCGRSDEWLKSWHPESRYPELKYSSRTSSTPNPMLKVQFSFFSAVFIAQDTF